MLDVFNTIVPSTAQFFEFNCGIESNTNRRTQVWNKPRGVSMLRFLLIGGGGGGSNGHATRSAGGGSGAITSWLGPAIFVPDRLIIAPALGGEGGISSASAFSGAGGINTFVLLTNTSVLFSASGGGGAGSGAGGGGLASSPIGFTSVGIFNSIAGQSGGNPNTAVTASATCPLGGGAGGSNTTTGLGASVTPLYEYPIVNGGATSGAKGEDGYFMTQPILFGCGGAGGAGNASGVGGRGGNGGIGCGGGGGGVGSTAGGAGGRGGNGAVYIWAW